VATQTSGEPVRHDGPCMNSLSSVSIYCINLSLAKEPVDPPFFSTPISRLAECNNRCCSVVYRSNMAETHASWNKTHTISMGGPRETINTHVKDYAAYITPRSTRIHLQNSSEIHLSILLKLIIGVMTTRWHFYSTANVLIDWCNKSYLSCHGPDTLHFVLACTRLALTYCHA
jgi:hypothetical protein